MAERRVWIVADAVADLPPTEILRTRYGIGPITQIPLWVHFGEKSYRAGVDLDNAKFKKLLDETKIIPKTAASTPEVFLEEYRKLTDSGLEVVSIHVGDNLSETGENARRAAKVLGNGRVSIFNTETVSMAEGFYAIEAEKAAAAGASREEILALLAKLKKEIDLRAVTPNIPFLRQSGRLGSATALLAGVLKINPILQVDSGIATPIERPRTMGKAMDWLVNFTKEQGELEQVAILDFEAGVPADLLKARLINELKIPEKIIYRGELGQLTGTHGGPGTWALATMRKG